LRKMKRGKKWYIEVGRAQKIVAFEQASYTDALLATLDQLRAARQAGLPAPPIALQHINRMGRDYRAYLIPRLIRFGILDASHEAEARPILALVDEWINTKKQAERSTAHIRMLQDRVKSIISGIGASTVSDVTTDKVAAWLHEQRITPRAKAKQLTPKTMSARTYNHYRSHLSIFFAWLIDRGVCTHNPAASLPPLKADTDPRHQRRVLSHTQLTTLLTSVRASKRRCAMSGEHRYWLYRLAAETGLRANECRQLLASDIDAVRGRLTVRASTAKNAKTTTLPLKVETAKGVKAICDDGLIFPAMPLQLANWLKADCAAVGAITSQAKKTSKPKATKKTKKKAGIAYKTDQGYFDFHALRHTYLTRLGESRLPLASIMALGRHSSAELAAHYMHDDVAQSRAAIEAMPGL